MIGYSGANVQVVRQALAFSSTLLMNERTWERVIKEKATKVYYSTIKVSGWVCLASPTIFFVTFSLPIWILISSALIFRGSKTSSLAYLSFSSFSLCSRTTTFVHGGWVSRKVYGQQVGTKWFIMFNTWTFRPLGTVYKSKNLSVDRCALKESLSITKTRI